MSAVGFDILFQSLDGASFAAIIVLDPSDEILFSDPFIAIDTIGISGGAQFVGFVSSTANITKIIIDEFDENNRNPDSNIGFDTFHLPAIGDVPDLRVAKAITSKQRRYHYSGRRNHNPSFLFFPNLNKVIQNNSTS